MKKLFLSLAFLLGLAPAAWAQLSIPTTYTWPGPAPYAGAYQYPDPFYTAGADRDSTPYPIVVSSTTAGLSLTGGVFHTDGSRVINQNVFADGPLGTSVAGLNVFSIDVPPGGPYLVKVCDVNNAADCATSATTLLIGDSTVRAGQSNDLVMCSPSDRSASPPAAYSQAAVWFDNPLAGNTFGTQSWIDPNTAGDGVISYLDALIDRTKRPQAAICVSVGGTTLTKDAWLITGSTASLSYHLDTSAGAQPWASTVAGIRALHGRVSRVIWTQGESDSWTAPKMSAAYLYWRGLESWWRNIQALVIDRAAPELRVMMVDTGHYDTSSVPGAAVDVHFVNDAKAMFRRLHPEAYPRSPEQADLLLQSDNVHLLPGPGGTQEMGIREANMVAQEEYLH